VEKVLLYKNKKKIMNQDKLDIFNTLSSYDYFSKEYIMGKVFNFSFSEIQYLKGLEIMEKRNKKIDELLND
jgi:uncharacterized membrane-anchored protein YitT (DUF2179 family)